MTERISSATARKQFAAVVQRSSAGARIKLTRYDSTLVVLIPKTDLEKLETCEREHARLRRRRQQAGTRK